MYRKFTYVGSNCFWDPQNESQNFFLFIEHFFCSGYLYFCRSFSVLKPFFFHSIEHLTVSGFPSFFYRVVFIYSRLLNRLNRLLNRSGVWKIGKLHSENSSDYPKSGRMHNLIILNCPPVTVLRHNCPNSKNLLPEALYGVLFYEFLDVVAFTKFLNDIC